MNGRADSEGLFIIRAWSEGEPPTLRVRMTATTDLVSSPQIVLSSSDVQEILSNVTAWLMAVTRRQPVFTATRSAITDGDAASASTT
ncbi:MAG: hypothetical protein ABR600_09015 [Actinomycetota bacterium]